MYAYVVHPETIPKSYYNFISTTGPISDNVLKMVRKTTTVISPISTDEAVSTVIAARGTGQSLYMAQNLHPYPNMIPCEILHSPEPNCNAQTLNSFSRVLRNIFPVIYNLILVANIY